MRACEHASRGGGGERGSEKRRRGGEGERRGGEAERGGGKGERRGGEGKRRGAKGKREGEKGKRRGGDIIQDTRLQHARKEALDMLQFQSAQERSTRYSGILKIHASRAGGEGPNSRRRRPEKMINDSKVIIVTHLKSARMF